VRVTDAGPAGSSPARLSGLAGVDLAPPGSTHTGRARDHVQLRDRAGLLVFMLGAARPRPGTSGLPFSTHCSAPRLPIITAFTVAHSLSCDFRGIARCLGSSALPAR